MTIVGVGDGGVVPNMTADVGLGTDANADGVAPAVDGITEPQLATTRIAVAIATERAQRAIRLCPFDNTISYMALSVAQIIGNQYERARESALRAVESNPSFSIPHAMLAVALVGANRKDEAKAEARTVLELDPTFTTTNWAVTVGQMPEVFGPIAKALRKVGIS
jgi:Flp pilus assembly protein TadD